MMLLKREAQHRDKFTRPLVVSTGVVLREDGLSRKRRRYRPACSDKGSLQRSIDRLLYIRPLIYKVDILIMFREVDRRTGLAGIPADRVATLRFI